MNSWSLWSHSRHLMTDSVTKDPMIDGSRESGLLSSLRTRKNRQCKVIYSGAKCAVFMFSSQVKMRNITSVHQINALPSSTGGRGRVTSSGQWTLVRNDLCRFSADVVESPLVLLLPYLSASAATEEATRCRWRHHNVTVSHQPGCLTLWSPMPLSHPHVTITLKLVRSGIPACILPPHLYLSITHHIVLHVFKL